MTVKDDFHSFLALENELDLYSIKVDGIKIWERIRVHIFTKIEQKIVSEKIKKPPKKPALSRLMRYLLSIFNLFKNPFLAPKSQLLFVCTYRRVLENDSYWWNTYIDPIIQKLEVPPVTIEEGNGGVHYNPAKTPNLFHTDFIESLSYFKQKLKLVRCHIKKSEIRQLNEIRDRIEDKFGIRIDIVSLVVKTLVTRKARLPLYQKMLKHIKPEVVVVGQGYNRADFLEACKSLRIKIVELQHGAIYPFHPGYSYGTDKKIDTFVDYILLWGDYWKNDVNFPISDNNVISTGFPYLENKLRELQEIPKKKQILFISQPNISEILSEFAIALGNDPAFDYKIVYKLHPRELVGWRRGLPLLVTSNVEVADPENKTLHELFAESIIQVGVCSTALFEGLAFGLQTYMVDAQCVEVMDSLFKTGMAKKVSTPEELKKLINEDKDLEQLDLKYFFRKNSVENIVSFLGDLCQFGNLSMKEVAHTSRPNPNQEGFLS
jgi:hypothetical protein